MAPTLQKLATVLMTAYFAVLSGGQVLVHQLTASVHCHCHGAVVETQHALCDCPDHSAPQPASENDSESSSIGDRHDCRICEFYRMAVQPAATAAATLSATLVAEQSDLVSADVATTLATVYLSRGPPLQPAI